MILTPADIIAAVASYYRVTPGAITGQKRQGSITRPRHIAFFLCRELTDMSLEEIGFNFGNRDHTTIRMGCINARQRLRHDEDLQRQIEVIQHNLGVRVETDYAEILHLCHS